MDKKRRESVPSDFIRYFRKKMAVKWRQNSGDAGYPGYRPALKRMMKGFHADGAGKSNDGCGLRGLESVGEAGLYRGMATYSDKQKESICILYIYINALQ